MQDASANCYPFKVLAPHPRWRWGTYPLRWLIGGCWSLWRLPLRGSMYGAIFFSVAYSWNRALTDFTGSSFALATALTGLTLLMAPRLTAGLLEGAARRKAVPTEDEAQRQGALIGLGALLVLILSLALNSALAGFAILYNGDVPPLDGLFPAVFSWQNTPLAVLLLGLIFIAGLSMQLVAVLPTFLLLRQPETDLFAAVRSGLDAVWLNWRPLAWWCLASQLLLFAGGSLMPVSLVLLAPLIACGSWWACREMAWRGPETPP